MEEYKILECCESILSFLNYNGKCIGSDAQVAMDRTLDKYKQELALAFSHEITMTIFCEYLNHKYYIYDSPLWERSDMEFFSDKFGESKAHQMLTTIITNIKINQILVNSIS